MKEKEIFLQLIIPDQETFPIRQEGPGSAEEVTLLFFLNIESDITAFC